MGRCSRKKYKTRFVLQLVFVKWVGFGLCFYLKCVDFYNFLAVKSGGVRKRNFYYFFAQGNSFRWGLRAACATDSYSFVAISPLPRQILRSSS